MQEGYAHYFPRVSQKYDVEDLTLLKSEFAQLEKDEYAPPGVNRFRRYGNGVLLPWQTSSTVHWLPIVLDQAGRRRAGYDQGGNNPEHTNIRYFHSLSEKVKNDRVLLDLIGEDFSYTFWSRAGQPLPVYFGVHFVKLVSLRPDDLGISSPNFFHQDGEPFTFAHLVHRSKNMIGGINYIASVEARDMPIEEVAPEKIISQFTLSKPLESFVVHDPKVSHYVSPVRKADEHSLEECERSIILIDFSATAQEI